MDSKNDALNNSLQPLMNWLFCEPNPIAINTAMIMTGAVNPVFRMPYVPLNDEQQQQGETLINQLNEQDFVGSRAQCVDISKVLILS